MNCSVLKPCAGLLLQMLGLLIGSSSSILFKMSTGIPADYFGFSAASVLTVTAIPFVICTCKKEDFTVKLYTERYVHTLRGICSWASFVLSMMSVRFIRVSDMTALMMNAPFIVTLLSYFLLKERFGPSRVVLMVLSSVGVVLVCRPKFIFPSQDENSGQNQVLGYGLGLLACLTHSVTYICNRKIRLTPISVMMLSNSAIGVVVCLVMVVVRSSWYQMNCPDSPLLLSAILCICSCTLLMFTASRMEEAGRLAVMMVVDLPFVIVVEVLAFGVVIPWTSYAGAAILSVSILALILLKKREGDHRHSIPEQVICANSGNQVVKQHRETSL